MLDIKEIRPKRIVYAVPGMDRVRIQRDLTFKEVDGITLLADVYRPPSSKTVPAVILVAGTGPWEVLRAIKDFGVYRSYGELLAASGLGAVTFNHRSPDIGLPPVAEDVDDLIEWVRNHAGDFGLDPDRLAVWTFSGGPPFGFRTVLRDRPAFVRCLLSFYGVLDYRHVAEQMGFGPSQDPAVFSPAALLDSGEGTLPPIFVAKAGIDQPWIKESNDRFIAESLRLDLTLDVMTHPEGRHSFDILDDDDRSREIIRRAIEFLREHVH